MNTHTTPSLQNFTVTRSRQVERQVRGQPTSDGDGVKLGVVDARERFALGESAAFLEFWAGPNQAPGYLRRQRGLGAGPRFALHIGHDGGRLGMRYRELHGWRLWRVAFFLGFRRGQN